MTTRVGTETEPGQGGSTARWVLPLAAVLIGLLVGLGAGWLAFGGDAEASGDAAAPGEGSSVDLDAMCDLVTQLPEMSALSGEDPSFGNPLEEPGFWRTNALAMLAVAAGIDSGDEELETAGTDLNQAFARLSLEDIPAAVATIESRCA
ncbi:hypothetical protein [Ornithinimicrobium cavernae]|uniref:hypothetical protein n=1 Tax=Ornithinimicrobium cavernae TaxID=2666047 RepID=UPI000D68A1C9|nr:hypothetical protein [Ornithinimicrobium cavernae]